MGAICVGFQVDTTSKVQTRHIERHSRTKNEPNKNRIKNDLSQQKRRINQIEQKMNFKCET